MSHAADSRRPPAHEAPSTPDHVSSVARFDAWALAQLEAAYRRRLLQQPLVLGAYLGVAFAVLLLWRAGYSTWRITAVALLCSLALTLEFCRVARARADAQRPSLNIVNQTLVVGSIWLVVVAITGGLRSPLIVGTIAGYSGALSRLGYWSGATRYLTCSFATWAVLLAVLPASVVGPVVPDPAFSIVSVLGLLLVSALESDLITHLSRAVRDSLLSTARAREEVASQALHRARELERLGAQISHELKNPLTAVKALVQLSARHAESPAQRERLEVAEREVERMRAILEEHLSFSRPAQPLQRSEVELASVADEVLAIFEARALTSDVKLRRTGGATAFVDARRLKEALINLVANALDASAAGGLVELRIAPAGEGARVEVHDQGSGMAPEVAARVGTPFFTTRGQGTGLGVSLARAIVAGHGGSLEYASRRGQGTVATISLPGQREASGEERSLQPPPSA